MMVLVVGGSGSGKSAYAEETAVLLSKEGDGGRCMKKYYLAAMQVFDEEGRRKVERHRRLRSGKGFLTIEQPAEIHKALEKMEAGKRTVLLECISNLTANEMFPAQNAEAEEEKAWQPKTQGLEAEVVEHVIQGAAILKEHVTHLVVVSSNVFEDGIVYDEAVMAYMRTMGKINQKLAAMADQVVETAAGIAVVIKR